MSMLSYNESYLQLQNLIFGWLQIIVGCIGTVVLGWRFFADVVQIPQYDIRYTKFIVIYVEGAFALICLIVASVSFCFVAGIRKRNTCLMTPYCIMCMLGVLTFIVMTLYDFIYIFALIFYTYLTGASFLLWKTFFDEFKEDVKMYGIASSLRNSMRNLQSDNGSRIFGGGSMASLSGSMRLGNQFSRGYRSRENMTASVANSQMDLEQPPSPVTPTPTSFVESTSRRESSASTSRIREIPAETYVEKYDNEVQVRPVTPRPIRAARQVGRAVMARAEMMKKQGPGTANRANNETTI